MTIDNFTINSDFNHKAQNNFVQNILNQAGIKANNVQIYGVYSNYMLIKIDNVEHELMTATDADAEYYPLNGQCINQTYKFWLYKDEPGTQRGFITVASGYETMLLEREAG